MKIFFGNHLKHVANTTQKPFFLRSRKKSRKNQAIQRPFFWDHLKISQKLPKDLFFEITKKILQKLSEDLFFEMT